MNSSKQKNNSNKKKITAAVAVIVILLASIGLVVAVRNRHVAKKTTTTPASVNLSPPTEEDKTRVDDNKERIANDSSKPGANGSQAPSAQTATVTPTISYAGVYDSQVEVGAYVSGVVENDGTCTATFKLGNNTVTKSVQGVANSSTVACPAITAPVSDFTQKGDWTVTVTYTSPKANGTSAAKIVTIK